MLPVERTIVPHVIKRQELATLAAGCTVRAAVKLMVQRHIGAVLITERGRLAGIFTERDVTERVVGAGRNPDRTTLGQVMTAKPDAVAPSDSVRAALELMARGGYRHLPVVDGRRLIGIVSIRDLYRSVIDQMEADILVLAEGLLNS